MFRAPRMFALAAVAAFTVSGAYADQYHNKPKPSLVISKMTAAPFQLKQVSTRKISDTESTSLYRADAVLTITPPAAGSTPLTLNVQVELRTRTILNANGDGLTDGVISLYAPSSNERIFGALTAVNENFGELTGVIEGGLAGRDGVRLRAVFNGTFVKDSSGAYTLVNVDAHGVQLAYLPGGPKK